MCWSWVGLALSWVVGSEEQEGQTTSRIFAEPFNFVLARWQVWIVKSDFPCTPPPPMESLLGYHWKGKENARKLTFADASYQMPEYKVGR
ncbi:hypothetical protein BDV95DRAFT_21073 [Massariosphaeria phaeospora]|uniref:Secreted protein n=1 Tax=Massariosphaeria phaeospora TaxID=100035 RepID=A0A7C8IIE9_9PLEO|nr:hypothetical protein BDV95DRAFT_21073 [Massariosphaeria phaeospora]